jgi:hypothetical protein
MEERKGYFSEVHFNFVLSPTLRFRLRTMNAAHL